MSHLLLARRDRERRKTQLEEQEEEKENREQALHWARCFRRRIDAISWQSWRDQVDYFAVFLLQLRLQLTAEVVRKGVDPVGGPASTAADLLPWHREEESRMLRESLPAIGTIWAALAPHLDKPPYVGLLCETINRLADVDGVRVSLGSSCWRQWCHRAGKEAQSQTSPEDWQEWFARWFPQREKRQWEEQLEGNKSCG